MYIYTYMSYTCTSLQLHSTCLKKGPISDPPLVMHEISPSTFGKAA